MILKPIQNLWTVVSEQILQVVDNTIDARLYLKRFIYSKFEHEISILTAELLI